MKAMSDPNRVRIIKLLQIKQLCVCEIRELLGLAQSTVSKHLKTLEDIEFIESQRDGSWIIYQINTSIQCPYVEMMLTNLHQWHEEDPVLITMQQLLPQIDRERIIAA